MLVLKGLVDLCRTVQLHFFSISIWGIDLDYCDVEWFIAGVQPQWIQRFRRGDGFGDQETTAYLNVN